MNKFCPFWLALSFKKVYQTSFLTLLYHMELCVCGEIKEILGKGNRYMKQILTYYQARIINSSTFIIKATKRKLGLSFPPSFNPHICFFQVCLLFFSFLFQQYKNIRLLFLNWCCFLSVQQIFSFPFCLKEWTQIVERMEDKVFVYPCVFRQLCVWIQC